MAPASRPVHAEAYNYGFLTDAAPIRGRGRKEAKSETLGGAMEIALQGAIWLGAGVTLVMLLSRRRRRNEVR